MNLRRHPTGPRNAAADAARARILSAARAVLAEPRASAALSIDAVAARAGVARALMQQQFGTAGGLLEVLWDDLLSEGCLVELPRALQHADPFAALAELIAVFGRFWDAERTVVRRLKAHAAFDPDLAGALLARERDLREGLQRLALRLSRAAPAALPAPLACADLLAMLTAFETFDRLAGAERTIKDVVPAIQALARTAFGRGA